MASVTTVEQYLAALPEDRRSALGAVREVILRNLDPEYEEGVSYGMIGYVVPHKLYPAGYHCDPKQPLPFAVLGAQKNHMSLHLMCLYSTGDPDGPAGRLQDWFRAEWAKSGKKLDMGKACIRFRTANDLALDVIGKVVRKVPARTWIARNQEFLESRPAQRSKPSQAAARKKKKPAAAG